MKDMNEDSSPWEDVISLAELRAKAKTVVRRHGRQILLVASEAGVFACANRCPHEGYPLSEGVLTDGCVLTCNWHNWKFDLADGRTLVGGDRLRRFPVRVFGGRVLLDMTPDDPTTRQTEVLAGLRRALADADEARLVREAARLERLPGGELEAVRAAIAWAAERLEFGTTHAIAGAPDWLGLRDDRATTADERLAAIGEILSHIAEDAIGGGGFPFPAAVLPWDTAAFARAIEAEDEASAVGRLRGALADGVAQDEVVTALARAALAHYADFGHSLIYVGQTARLIERLGEAVREPLLLMLVRSLVYARREDLLPEFRDYAGRLGAWPGPAGAAKPLAASSLIGLSARQAMAATAGWAAHHPPESIFAALVEAAAWQLLHADEARFDRTGGKIADNFGWLDFTHSITFARAGSLAVRNAPDLWPALLLQLACFIGRNAGCVDGAADVAAFAVTDAKAFAAAARKRLFDHGQARFIISVHLVKILGATLPLAESVPEAAPVLLAAVNRFLQARIKGRHVLRTAHQMRAFVAQE